MHCFADIWAKLSRAVAFAAGVWTGLILTGACAMPGGLGDNPAVDAGLLIASNLKSINQFMIRAGDNPALNGDVVATIDQANGTITAFVPSGTDRSALVPSVEYAGAAISPPSGQAADFRDLVQYTVIGDDGSAAAYQVNLRDASLEANSITAFTFRRADNGGFTGDVAGTIFEDSGVINVVLPTGTALTSLTPTIAVNGAALSPASGTAMDFSSPVQYTVTAANGTTRTYNIIAAAARDSSNQITNFGFTMAANGGLPYNLTGSINQNNQVIHVTIPHGTAITALRANFTLSGGTIALGGTNQTSDVTVNDFTSPVTYTVTAQDGTPRNYTVILSEGLYVGGAFTSYNGQSARGLIRLHLDGTRDTSFNTGSGFDLNIGHSLPAPDNSGDMYFGGNFTTYQGSAANGIIRLNSDGSRDTGFNMGTGFNSAVRFIIAVPDGSGDIYAVGTFTSYNGTAAGHIIRLNSDGSIDTTLNVTGAGQAFNGNANVLALAPDGSGDILVGGAFTTYKGGTTAEGLIRLNADGTVDTSLGVTGVNQGFNGQVHEIRPLTNGDLYIGGDFTTYKTVAAGRILRLNADGSRDTAFDAGTGPDGQVENIIEIAGTSDIFVAGNFSNFSGLTITNLIRLNADGTRDTAYSPAGDFNGGVSGLVYNIVPLRDGSGDYFVGGDYTVYDNTFYDGLVRINADGTPDSGYTPGGFNSFVLHVRH